MHVLLQLHALHRSTAPNRDHGIIRIRNVPQILYDDGDEEVALLCKDKATLQVWLEPGEAATLPRPSRSDIEAQASALFLAADKHQEEADQQEKEQQEKEQQHQQQQQEGGRRHAHRLPPEIQRMRDEGAGCLVHLVWWVSTSWLP